MGPKVASVVVGGLVVSLALACALEPAAGQGKKGAKGKKGKGASIALTPTAREGWHIKVNGVKGQRHVFTGRLTALGGNINSVNSFVQVDPGDHIRMDGRQQVLTFRLTNLGGNDHFNVHFTPQTKQVACEILVDGRSQPGAVFVRGKHPGGSAFTVAAHPGKGNKKKK